MGKELFDNIPSKVGDLLNDVKNGRIGLPDCKDLLFGKIIKFVICWILC